MHEAVQVLCNWPPCPRNGRSLRACRQWKAARTLASASNRSACSLVSTLAVSTFDSITHNPGSWADFIRQMLCGNNGRLLGDENIESIIFRCGAIADKQVVGNFIAMISFIQLAFRCQRHQVSSSNIFQGDPAPRESPKAENVYKLDYVGHQVFLSSGGRIHLYTVTGVAAELHKKCGMPDEEAEHEKQPTHQEDEEEDQGRGGDREDEQESQEGNQEDEDEGEGNGKRWFEAFPHPKLLLSQTLIVSVYIATKEAFPLPINKDSICWESILAAVKGNDLLTANLGNIKGDEEVKGNFIDY
ncbi:hypothetical protein PAXRUDRAFT_29112, partial [Paxillus rubicundulus Ve08.2h10]